MFSKKKKKKKVMMGENNKSYGKFVFITIAKCKKWEKTKKPIKTAEKGCLTQDNNGEKNR